MARNKFDQDETLETPFSFSHLKRAGKYIKRILDELSVGFSEKRLFPVDKSLLLMAMAEIRYIEGVPAVVAIDEAVGLAKKYSTEKSAGFVNGVLAAFISGGNNK